MALLVTGGDSLSGRHPLASRIRLAALPHQLVLKGLFLLPSPRMQLLYQRLPYREYSFVDSRILELCG